MITEKEIESVNLSPTKKDFYQIWNELLEVSTKLSSRWSPVSTNESDPGIVLLKVLAAVGDKLNYNIDKNILEAFMPSATQQESMRKLCDMMGYSIKYFRSATTVATIQYTGEWPESLAAAEITIPRFSTLKDTDDEIHYVTLEPVSLGENNRANTVNCIEGQICICENSANTNGFITMAQLDSNLRYYLPESQIAENGIFITSATILQTSADNTDTETIFDFQEWLPVENINSTPLNTPCYKFCFDSRRGLPYLQFPADVSNLINDGLLIKYIRTNGINGNIAARTLTSISKPDNFYADINIDDFVAVNINAATNGANIESINDAYNNYKKTIGTFDTLVTCRDYMNKIYQLVEDNDTKIDTTPLVSNIIVSDIRDDINRSFTLCEFSDYGIKYVDKVVRESDEDRINHFDIILYPFKTIANNVSENAYNNSFKYSLENSIKIEEDLDSYKTISHSIKYPVSTDIVCIKNYLKLNAKITTVNKVNLTEENAILSNIYTKIYTRFNARQLDFGEAIPFDKILECIETADTRIKNVALDEPILYTAFETANNNEYSIESSTSTDLIQAKTLYNKLALRNILAGKIALFNYNKDFKYEYSEKTYPSWGPSQALESYEPIYPTGSDKIVKLESEFKIDLNNQTDNLGLKLLENEIIQFRAPAYYTEVTYPAYVNYYLHLNNSNSVASRISRNCEYQLGAGEYLLINYTEASSDDSADQDKNIKNITYEVGTIIKPNFELADSADKKNIEKVNFTKTSGYSFTNAPAGMYTLGATEQIEIRKKSELVLGEVKNTTGTTYVPMNIYWDRLEEDKLERDGIVHFFEDNQNSYTLKPGEYFYFTDTNKLDMSYYGAGTEIIRTGGCNIDKVVDKTIKKLSADELLSGGINNIPWWKISTSESSNIKFKEYQYRTLTKDDELISITLATGETSLNNEYKKCSGVKYNLQGVEDSLPIIHTKASATEDDTWQVRSLLQFNMGPDQIQTLRSTSMANKPHITESINLYYYSATEPTEITPRGTPFVSVSLKSNYPCQLAYEVADVRVAKENVSTGKQEWINDFKLKVFEDSPLVIYNSSISTPISVHNFGDAWTKLSMKDYKEGSSPIELNVNLLDDTYGLVMMYVIAEDTEGPEGSAFLPYLKSDSTLKIFNYYTSTTSTEESWWQGYFKNNNYYLKHGINVIKVETSGQLKLYADTNKTATIILSDLDIININYNNSDSDLGINLAGLNYYFTGTGSETSMNRAKELLADINARDTDHSFYYNTRLENSECLDINTALDIKGQPIETLATPSILYDYNNVNNKFVISQIDTNYMKKYGISIAKSSKRTY